MDYKRLKDAQNQINNRLNVKANLKKVLQYHYLGYVPDSEIIKLKEIHPVIYEECVNEMNNAFNQRMNILN